MFGENGTNVTELFLSGMNAYKTYMAQTITPEWLSQMHPNPRVNKTNVQYLFDHFYEDAQGKDKNKMPTDDEIRVQADKYFKQFGIEGFADTFMQEAAYASKQKNELKSAQTILEKTGRSQAKRHMPRVKTETKKELKKLGFWNILKRGQNRDV